MTTYGRRVYAVGNSAIAARVSGLPVRPVQASVYAVAGLFYGIGGVMLLGFAGNAELRLGDEYLLPSIAAVLVGGTAIKGGRGSYVGTIGGVVLLTVVGLDITATGLAEGWKQVLYGAIVLAALVLAKRPSLGPLLSAARRRARRSGKRGEAPGE
jgi:ribose transport system permease protein